MDSKSKAGIIIAIIGLLGAAAGGSFMLDLSNTTTTNTSTDNSQSTIINEGDTIIHEAVETFTEDLFDEFIDRGYDYFCEEVEPDSPECDEYWEYP